MKIILARIAGGIAMIIWSFCSQTVLPLGEFEREHTIVVNVELFL